MHLAQATLSALGGGTGGDAASRGSGAQDKKDEGSRSSKAAAGKERGDADDDWGIGSLENVRRRDRSHIISLSVCFSCGVR